MAQSDFLTYKGRPIVRSGDTIYYGASSEKYVIMIGVTIIAFFPTPERRILCKRKAFT